VLKQKIKSRLKRWGHLHIPGASVFSQSGREAYLDELSHDRIRSQVESLYGLLDQTHTEKKAARRQLLELGCHYPETQEFQKIPGIGPISAHTFDAYIQTPHRFATKQKLWRYCKLGVQKRSSGGNQIQRENSIRQAMENSKPSVTGQSKRPSEGRMKTKFRRPTELHCSAQETRHVRD
jgi:transposase